MTEKKTPESPFSKNQLEFKESAPNKSFPAVRPDDKRLQYSSKNLCKGNLIRTLPALVHDETKLEDVQRKGLEDHAPDALRYGMIKRPSISIQPMRKWMRTGKTRRCCFVSG